MSRLALLLRRFSASGNRIKAPIPPGPPILFLHMPKTAGTSLRRMLQTVLGMDAVYPSDNDLRRRPNGLYPSEADILADYPSLRRYFVLAGHFLASFADHLPPPHRTAVFLRDPVLRSLSTLAHFHRTMKVEPHKLLDDPVFVEHQIRDFQTAVLGKRYNATSSQPWSRILDTALMTLEALDFVGITEHFPMSCRLFDTTFGTHVSSVILKENVLRPQGTELDDLIPRILPLVEADQVLYEYANARFVTQVGTVQQSVAQLRRAA